MIAINDEYPLLPVRNSVVLPTNSIYLMVEEEKSISAIESAQVFSGKVVIAAIKSEEISDKIPNNLEKTNFHMLGTLCQVDSVVKINNTSHRILVTGLSRFKICKINLFGRYYKATGSLKPDVIVESSEAVASFNQLKTLIKEMIKLLPEVGFLSLENIEKIQDPRELVYSGALFVNLNFKQMQELLEENSMIKKIFLVLKWLNREKEILLLEKDIKDKVGINLTKLQKEMLLREQLKIIKKELGETDRQIEGDYIKQIETIEMPTDVRKVAIREASRIVSLHEESSDYQVLSNYLDWICQMPWSKSRDELIDIEKSEQILNKHHFDLEKIKKRILQFIAVTKLSKNSKGTILCLLGPPGVGKTSLGKSIAEALGRDFISISLAGIKDEAEIRGHRRTYVGAMPGSIIQAIKRVGNNNPVILLDEIDKIGVSHQGNASSALLEVLDPEQNKQFVDNYLNLPFDLSTVFFMATANQLDTIPRPLVDRMEIIELSSYTLKEKVKIGEKYIIPQVLAENGLESDHLIIDPKILSLLIEHYTRESGVRELKRLMSTICSGVAFQIVKGKKTPIHINEDNIVSYLGPSKFLETQKLRRWTPGLATGMAWTPFGGEILYLECIKIPGSGRLKLTGQLGDVMKESAELALSYTHSIIAGIPTSFDFSSFDIHLHIPAGAISKDGPSAGLAILTAIVSLITKKKVDQNLAMTGELTLTGSVLPVGGVKEKILAAYRYKISKVIIPKQNEKDLYEIPDEVKNELDICLVECADDVIEKALNINIDKTQFILNRGDYNAIREKSTEKSKYS